MLCMWVTALRMFVLAPSARGLVGFVFSRVNNRGFLRAVARAQLQNGRQTAAQGDAVNMFRPESIE